jgi:hypothetical protein
VRSCKSNPLTLWTLLGLLSLIALVVILPDVDLPDTAFRSNSSPLAIRTLYQQVPHANAAANPLRQSMCSLTLHCPSGSLRETRTRSPQDLAIEHKSLRC